MGWIIAGAVLIVILLVTLCRVTVIFSYDGNVFLDISFLGITLFHIPKVKKSSKKPKKKKKKPEKADDEDKKEKKKKPKPALSDILELAKLALDSLGKPLKKILKRTEFSHIGVDVTCGGEDAAKAAINYGAANILLGNALSLIDTFFTLKTPDDLHIGVDFYSEKTVAKIYCEVRLTAAAALAFVFTLLGRVIRYYLTHKEARNAVKSFTG